MKRAVRIELTEEERRVLGRWKRSGTVEQRLARRAGVVLACAGGLTNQEVAEEVRMSPAAMGRWRRRFAADRLAGLGDAPRPGRVRRYGAEVERRIWELLDQPPPEGYGQWNGRLLAERLGDVSVHQVWRILRRRGCICSGGGPGA